jgi:hypothetical protein
MLLACTLGYAPPEPKPDPPPGGGGCTTLGFLPDTVPMWTYSKEVQTWFVDSDCEYLWLDVKGVGFEESDGIDNGVSSFGFNFSWDIDVVKLVVASEFEFTDAHPHGGFNLCADPDQDGDASCSHTRLQCPHCEEFDTLRVTRLKFEKVGSGSTELEFFATQSVRDDNSAPYSGVVWHLGTITAWN